MFCQSNANIWGSDLSTFSKDTAPWLASGQNAVISTSMPLKPRESTHGFTETHLDFSDSLIQTWKQSCCPGGQIHSLRAPSVFSRASIWPDGSPACFRSSGDNVWLLYCCGPLGENYGLPSSHMTRSLSPKAANTDQMPNKESILLKACEGSTRKRKPKGRRRMSSERSHLHLP